MSFISSAVKLIHGKKSTDQVLDNIAEEKIEGQISESTDVKDSVVDNSTDFDFSLRNYAKESFSVLIQKPLSACMLKLMRGVTFTVIGLMSGTLFASLVFLIFMQFGSFENTIISSFIASKFEKIFPDTELSIRSANFYWNPDSNSLEIGMKKVRLNDFLITHVSIKPDYIASIKEQNLVAESISITNPKILLDLSEDWQHITIDPNLGNKSGRKSVRVPLNSLMEFKQVINSSKMKIINADVTLCKNKDNMNLKNVYCEYDMNASFPSAIAGSVMMPKQKYSSNFSIQKTNNDYRIKLTDVNPDLTIKTMEKFTIPVDQKIVSMLSGYNLPISGRIDLNFNKGNLSGGAFELKGNNGSVKLPSSSVFSLNLGKKIDRGDISGTFNAKEARIDSLRMNYDDSGLQVTGIQVPLDKYKFLNIANIDGTLSLTNIGVSEMNSLLPRKVSTCAVALLQKCLPEFNLEMFRVDLKGPVMFSNENAMEGLKIGQGTFTVRDAQIPLGAHYIKHVSASGIVMEDGIDIKIASADFNGIKINQGVMYIAGKDGALIGNANIDLPITQVSEYAKYISPRLQALPLDKLGVKGTANLDIKIASLNTDKKSAFPFKIIEGNGAIASDMNAKQVKVAWNSKNLSLSGDINSGNNRISIQFNENYEKDLAHSSLKFMNESPFLKSYAPMVTNLLKGEYILTLDTDWKDGLEDTTLTAKLNNATLSTPFTGTVGNGRKDGHLTAHVVKHDGVYDISNIKFVAGKNKLEGAMTVSDNGRLLRCNLPVFLVNDSKAKIQIVQKEDNHMFMSAVGEHLDFDQIAMFFNSHSIKALSSVYLNLEKIRYGTEHLRNVQGTIEMEGGKIVGGACYGVLGKDTTVALLSNKVNGENVTTVSASNAGDFMRYFRVGEGVVGGNINIVINSNHGLGTAQSGFFEINNCIVKDSKLLGKMVSLSSINLLPNTDNISLGFNRCTGKFIITDTEIAVDRGVALSPSFAIGFTGKYDRQNDNLNVTGSCVPMSSYYSLNASGILSSPFSITGSIGNPQIQVFPIEAISVEAAQDLTGNALPMLIHQTALEPEFEPMGYVPNAYDRQAFDNQAKRNEVAKEEVPVQRQNGVTVVRGKPSLKK